ncbi:hypothetical protein BpHYR1_039994 [Brachionus plicatilis]|uniref:Uncharacterized protein n=1 Tax=Brachionus plicatilis TaxID=10195 RepID=A0A3M7SI22_BRAPC|nr:hypothetical protein BpHYR1_039994 [Brachionus plicatilis]
MYSVVSMLNLMELDEIAAFPSVLKCRPSEGLSSLRLLISYFNIESTSYIFDGYGKLNYTEKSIWNEWFRFLKFLRRVIIQKAPNSLLNDIFFKQNSEQISDHIKYYNIINIKDEN